MDDGHIYWIQAFSNIYGEEKATTHNDEAFWIQTRVLEWAGYPEIKTMDQYFDLIESYQKANPINMSVIHTKFIPLFFCKKLFDIRIIIYIVIQRHQCAGLI